MKSIKILDVTLRDGGCVNNFNFGNEYIQNILAAQENSGLDVIEMGYIDEEKGSECKRTQYCNEQVITKNILKQKKEGIEYVAMIDYGKYDFNKLLPHSNNSIDGIRMAFHKKDRYKIVEIGDKIMSLGYKFYIQPMITMRYSDSELLELIDLVNKELPSASGFYIVDTFGEMRSNDINRMLSLVDHNLISSMTLGFHSHNNLQMSYSNAISFIQFPTNRNLMLDSSIMGMGKGAGNLNTELILEHLNLYYGKSYEIAPLLKVIDTVLNPLRSEFYWGYSIEYYLSASHGCTPTYASHFYKKHMLPIDKVSELLDEISEEKKISFDIEYAERLYRKFNARENYNDQKTIDTLKTIFYKKNVLIIAPGKSLNKDKELIELAIGENDVSISLNCDIYDTNFILTTRENVYHKYVDYHKNIIVPSNIVKRNNDDTSYVIDYAKWILISKNKTEDSSGVIILNLMKALGVKSITLAGFDGFSPNINDNYYNASLRNSIEIEQLEEKNHSFANYIEQINKLIPICFVTKSIYENYFPKKNTKTNL